MRSLRKQRRLQAAGSVVVSLHNDHRQVKEALKQTEHTYVFQLNRKIPDGSQGRHYLKEEVHTLRFSFGESRPALSQNRIEGQRKFHLSIFVVRTRRGCTEQVVVGWCFSAFESGGAFRRCKDCHRLKLVCFTGRSHVTRVRCSIGSVRIMIRGSLHKHTHNTYETLRLAGVMLSSFTVHLTTRVQSCPPECLWAYHCHSRHGSTKWSMLIPAGDSR